MIKFGLIAVIVIVSLTSCLKNKTDDLNANALVISFNPDKCGCCWGWKLVMEKDTIKSESIIIQDVVGFNVNAPIPVYIKLGEKTQDCSAASDPINNKDYYIIESIELVNN